MSANESPFRLRGMVGLVSAKNDSISIKFLKSTIRFESTQTNL